MGKTYSKMERKFVDLTRSISNRRRLFNYNKPLYFVSKEELDQKVLVPKIPNNFLTEHGYEDNVTPRICFSDDVGNCLMALSQNLEGQTFNVYTPYDVKDYQVYRPTVKAVSDSKITGELWILEPVTLKKIGSIYVSRCDVTECHEYTYGSHTAYLYGWIWKWISYKGVTVR